MGKRFRASKIDKPGVPFVVDLVDLTLQPALRPLCENLSSVGSIDDCPGIARLIDTVMLRDELFIAVTALPLDARPYDKLTDSANFWADAYKLVSALRYLHRRELVHAAICPDTVYWTKEGPVLGEFWWMHNAECLPLANLASEDIAALMPVRVMPFLAYEQLAGEPPTRDSDLYALGALFYFLLSGRPPRNPASKDWLLDPRRVLNLTPVIPLEEFAPGLDREIYNLVSLLMMNDRASRMNIFMLEALTAERSGNLPEDAYA
ncbi:MAG: hypothetical protein K2W95_12840 [Candidatus Obscuribacterales bacterium]|nr:hypothetical protein [Candidatus Obscuribacterales bacterium]